MFSLEMMHISVQKDDKAVYAAHPQFISFIQNVSISLVNMQITEINRCDCVYCFIGILWRTCVMLKTKNMCSLRNKENMSFQHHVALLLWIQSFQMFNLTAGIRSHPALHRGIPELLDVLMAMNRFFIKFHRAKTHYDVSKTQATQQTQS